VWLNALDKEDGSREFFKSTREADAKCDLKDFMDVRGGGEEKVLEDVRIAWRPLRSRMKDEDGTGERKAYLIPKSPSIKQHCY
jgi:hypothetical protein